MSLVIGKFPWRIPRGEYADRLFQKVHDATLCKGLIR